MSVTLRSFDQGMTEQLRDRHHVHAVHAGDGSLGVGKELKACTLTNLYDAPPQWLADVHAALDAAVARAYGWNSDISENEALQNPLTLNAASG